MSGQKSPALFFYSYLAMIAAVFTALLWPQLVVEPSNQRFKNVKDNAALFSDTQRESVIQLIDDFESSGKGSEIQVITCEDCQEYRARSRSRKHMLYKIVIQSEQKGGEPSYELSVMPPRNKHYLYNKSGRVSAFFESSIQQDNATLYASLVDSLIYTFKGIQNKAMANLVITLVLFPAIFLVVVLNRAQLLEVDSQMDPE